jgi:hypothetical protein
VIDLEVLLSFLSFILEIQVGASGDCMDCSNDWEVGALLRELWVLWWGWQWIGL